MQEAKAETGNAPHVTVGPFSVLLSSSTPVSMLKAPQSLGRLLCLQEHTVNELTTPVPFPQQSSISDAQEPGYASPKCSEPFGGVSLWN